MFATMMGMKSITSDSVITCNESVGTPDTLINYFKENIKWIIIFVTLFCK